MNLKLEKWQVPHDRRVSWDKLYTVYGDAGTYSCGGLWNDGGTLFSKATRIRLNLEGVTGVRQEKGRQ